MVAQGLCEAFQTFGTEPDPLQPFFNHSIASIGPSAPTYAVGVYLHAVRNGTGDFELTGSRIVDALSLLAFDFGHQLNLTDLVEYNFDLIISRWKKPDIVIARGSVVNNI